jgi:hypothetical protein
MIAPTDLRRKGAMAEAQEFSRDRQLPFLQESDVQLHIPAVTESLAEFIIPPHFRPSTALLDCEKMHSALARSFRYRIPQPPAPRGRRDRAYSQNSLSPYWANASWSFFFLNDEQAFVSVLPVDTLSQRRNQSAAGAKPVLPNINEIRRQAAPHPLKWGRAEANAAPGSRF